MESGIRRSRPDGVASLEALRPMSFTVYKLEDLDARARVSAPPPAPPSEPSRWPAVWTSTKALAAAYMATRRQLVRPKLNDALNIPFATLRADLWAALGTLPWKKIGAYGGTSRRRLHVPAGRRPDDRGPHRRSGSRRARSTSRTIIDGAHRAARDGSCAGRRPAAARGPDSGRAADRNRRDQRRDETERSPLRRKTTRKKKPKVADIFNPVSSPLLATALGERIGQIERPHARATVSINGLVFWRSFVASFAAAKRLAVNSRFSIARRQAVWKCRMRFTGGRRGVRCFCRGCLS